MSVLKIIDIIRVNKVKLQGKAKEDKKKIDLSTIF